MMNISFYFTYLSVVVDVNGFLHSYGARVFILYYCEFSNVPSLFILSYFSNSGIHSKFYVRKSKCVGSYTTSDSAQPIRMQVSFELRHS